ncbi:hypothetical protein [Rhizobium sp. RAF56]|uniref:hypothetical protein n=1 Tax=Rhizobium sp. RAF56 TaxID=3233062 RepID=UPI003F9A4F34
MTDRALFSGNTETFDGGTAHGRESYMDARGVLSPRAGQRFEAVSANRRKLGWRDFGLPLEDCVESRRIADCPERLR